MLPTLKWKDPERSPYGSWKSIQSHLRGISGSKEVARSTGKKVSFDPTGISLHRKGKVAQGQDRIQRRVPPALV
jgi:hypothetical protein